jgi:hypothetical protein
MQRTTLVNFEQYLESPLLNIVKEESIQKERNHDNHKNLPGIPYGFRGVGAGHPPSIAVAKQFNRRYSADPNNNGRRTDGSDAHVSRDRHQPDGPGSQL